MSWKKRALRNRVEKRIREAFRGVKLGEGISLHQQIIVSNYGRDADDEEVTDLEWDRRGRAGIVDDWEKIDWSREPDDDEISMALLDYDGVLYYLPALMFRLLEVYDRSSMRVISTLMFLYPKNNWVISWESKLSDYSIFTDEQKAAIASFLNALPLLVELYPEDKATVERALRNYWHQFVPEEDEELQG